MAASEVRLDAYSKPSSFRRDILNLSRMGTGGGIGSRNGELPTAPRKYWRTGAPQYMQKYQAHFVRMHEQSKLIRVFVTNANTHPSPGALARRQVALKKRSLMLRNY